MERRTTEPPPPVLLGRAEGVGERSADAAERLPDVERISTPLASVAAAGRVEGVNGRGEPGWVVVFLAPADHDAGVGRTVRVLGEAATDLDGRFRAEQLAPAAAVEVVGIDERINGRSEVRLTDVDMRADRTDLVLRLNEPRYVTARRDPAVQPFFNDGLDLAHVLLYRVGQETEWRQPPSSYFLDEPLVDAPLGEPLALRIFTIEAMEPAGTLQVDRGELLLSSRGGDAFKVPIRTERSVAPPVPADWSSVEGASLSRWPSALLLLTVVDAASGAPLRSFELTTKTRGGSSRKEESSRSRVGPDGRCVVGVPLGLHLLTFQAPGFAAETVWLAPDEPKFIVARLRLRAMSPP